MLYMTDIDIATARKNLGQIIKAGQTVSITRYGKVVAFLIPGDVHSDEQVELGEEVELRTKPTEPVQYGGANLRKESSQERYEREYAAEREKIPERLTAWELKHGKGKKP
jgi:antitoxin (DNA-binding transcriptional repressor) of toxin-antitoxin stability system